MWLMGKEENRLQWLLSWETPQENNRTKKREQKEEEEMKTDQSSWADKLHLKHVV